MKILVTGFEPFGEDTVNASWEAVRRLPEEMDGHKIVKKRLCVSYGKVAGLLEQWLREEAPDVVLCVGQAKGRAAITPEKVAINWKAGVRPDNEGEIAAGTPLYPGEDAAYFATIPVEEIAAQLRQSGIPAKVSYTAGTFVCNATMYTLLRMTRGTTIRGGFLHVPCLPEQTADAPEVPSMALPLIVQGVCLAIRTIIADRTEETP